MATIQEPGKREDDLQGPSWQAELTFRDWKARLEAARANWAGAPSNLKLPLLLRGADLQEATSWMISRPRDLTPQQLSFIRKSIARSYSSAAEEDRQADAERKKQLKWWISFGATISAFLLFLGLQVTLYDLWVKMNGGIYVTQEAQLAIPKPQAQQPVNATAPVEAPNEPYGEVVMAPEMTAPMSPPTEPEAPPELRTLASPSMLADRAYEEASRDPVKARLIALEALAGVDMSAPLDIGLLPALAAIQTTSHRLSLGAGDNGPQIVRASLSRDRQNALLVSADHSAHWASIQAASAQSVAPRSILRDGDAIVAVADSFVAVAGQDEGIRMWPAGASQPAAVLKGHEAGVTALAMSRDKRRVVTTSWDETIRVWDAATGQSKFFLRGHEGPAKSASFSPDGMRIATAGEDRTARIWDASSAKLLTIMQGHSSGVESVAFDPSGRRVLTTSLDGTAALWDAASGNLQARLTTAVGQVASAAFGPAGQRVAVLSSRGEIAIWNADAAAAPLLVLPPADIPARSITLGHDDELLLTLNAHGVATLLDSQTGAILGVYSGRPGDRIVSAEFSDDGEQLMAITAANDLLRWPAFRSLAQWVSQTREAAPRCLSEAERRELQIDPVIPKWCLEHGKPTVATP